MNDRLLKVHRTRRPGRTMLQLATSLAGLAALVSAGWAQEKLLPPPYQIAGTNHVIVGVVWDETGIRKALPPEITPVKEMTGAINIYQAEKGYAIAPYKAAYFWVDLEGFDSPDGTKGRWMLQGVYGPQNKTSAALKEFSGFPVRNGTSRFEPTADGKRAIGTVDGRDFVIAEIKSAPDPCQAVAGLLNYPVVSPTTKQIAVNEIPYVGDVCKAEPISATVTAPPGDPFAAFKVTKVLWAIEFKNGAFSLNRPVSASR